MIASTRAAHRRLVPATSGLAAWLGLAASPTFAFMALVSATDAHEMATCLPVETPAVNGMALMYLLMSLFHAPSWLKLAAGAGPYRIPTKVKPKGTRP
ncbi:hypothetical protein FMN50_18600 [Rhodobacterales bacterium]|nr:hypothetical protein FMN50_18600 [Rhodobacterales bacterium]